MWSIAVKNAEKTNTLKNTALVSSRNDLRITDNKVLLEASKHQKLIGVYAIDPRLLQENQFGFTKLGKYRAKFLLESLEDLKTQLLKLNISLVCSLAAPEELIPEICQKHQVTHVYVQEEWTQEEKDALAKTKAMLAPSIAIHQYKDQFLFHPEDISFTTFSTIPEVFTLFRKQVEKHAKVRPLLPTPKTFDADNIIFTTNIPTLENLGFPSFKIPDHSAFSFKGGNNAATDRLHYYSFASHLLSSYKKTRNGLIGADYSSKLSAWLANGSISPREVYWQIKKYEEENIKNESTYWLVFELLWRDYFKYISLKHQNDIFKVNGISKKKYEWHADSEVLHKWISGTTNQPFVNANMKELAQTGFMSNRGRQNVASYWSKSLLQDWRYGAAYFEQMLIDYDVHSNWCNWLYVSGVGNDPRDRIFNVSLQAERYDPKNAYQNLWNT